MGGGKRRPPVTNIQLAFKPELREYASGNRLRPLDGKLHREDGRTIKHAYGTSEWWVNDKLHRTDGPAVENADGTRSWWQNGKLHRIDGPAAESAPLLPLLDFVPHPASLAGCSIANRRRPGSAAERGRPIERPVTAADAGGMPLPARLIALCLLAPLVAACGYDTGSDLRPALERVTPPGARVIGACGGSSGLIDEPSYTCTYLFPGEGGEVADQIATALRTDGFAVSCSRPGELAALRGDVRITAELTPGGWISTMGGVVNVYPPGYRPEGSRAVAKGSVAVDLSASRQPKASADFWRRYVAGGGRCDRPLVLPHPLEVCVTWWNGEVGMRASDTAARRRLGPQV